METVAYFTYYIKQKITCLTTFPHTKKRAKNKTRSIFHELQGVWKCGQTLFFLFDILLKTQGGRH